MTEQEAIELLDSFYEMDEMHDAAQIAIKALEEIQQYRVLESRLSDMFSGELTLSKCVDELELVLKEPDKPHPINAKILTYKQNSIDKYTRMTNADRIHSMSDEELAEFLEKILSGNRDEIGVNCGNSKCEEWKCTECISIWLQSEVEN